MPRHYDSPPGLLTIYGGLTRPSTFPSWRAAIPDWTWAQVGLNTLADINPGNNPALNPSYPSPAPWAGASDYQSIISKWSGGAWDEANKRFHVFGGGHSDYAGNELPAIDLGVNTPSWSLLRPPTGAIGNTGTLNDGLETSGKYFDGRPRSGHTYGLLNMVDNDLFYWPEGYLYANANTSLRAWKFSRSLDDWVDLGVPFATGADMASCSVFIPPRREVWAFPKSHGPWFALNVDTPTTYQVINQDPLSSATKFAVYDSLRNIVLIFGQYATGFIILDVANYTQPFYVPTITGNVTQQYSTEGFGPDGWVHDTINDRFYSRQKNGASVSALVPPSGDWHGTWTWGNVPAASANTVIPPAPAVNGTYGRIFFSPSLSCLGVINDVTQKLYVLAIGVGGTVGGNPPLVPSMPNATPFMVNGVRYSDPETARLAMADGDTLYMDPGYYRGIYVRLSANNCTIAPSSAGTIVLDAAGGTGYWDAGIIYLDGNNSTVHDIEIYGATGGEGVAGVRLINAGLTLYNFHIHDMVANGIMSNSTPNPSSNIVIHDGILERCGDGTGQVHNLYGGRDNSISITNVRSDDCNVGHSFKSRAASTSLINCQSIQGRGSRHLDVPTGGVVVVTGNTACRDNTIGGNRDFVGYGLEYTVPQWPTNSLTVNTNSIYDATSDMIYTHVAAWLTSGVSVSGPTPLGSCPL